MGLEAAKRFVYTGERWDAAKAKGHGLVSEVVPRDEPARPPVRASRPSWRAGRASRSASPRACSRPRPRARWPSSSRRRRRPAWCAPRPTTTARRSRRSPRSARPSSAAGERPAPPAAALGRVHRRRARRRSPPDLPATAASTGRSTPCTRAPRARTARSPTCPRRPTRRSSASTPRPPSRSCGQLAAIGAGGAVCYAAGFAEAGDAELERALVAAAGHMALLGPNCYGLINRVDGASLWPVPYPAAARRARHRARAAVGQPRHQPLDGRPLAADRVRAHGRQPGRPRRRRRRRAAARPAGDDRASASTWRACAMRRVRRRRRRGRSSAASRSRS